MCVYMNSEIKYKKKKKKETQIKYTTFDCERNHEPAESTAWATRTTQEKQEKYICAIVKSNKIKVKHKNYFTYL